MNELVDYKISDTLILPQEDMFELTHRKKQLTIGVPKEQRKQESRIPLTPESTEQLVTRGHRVLIESGAGKDANYTDNDFSESGAEIVHTKEELCKAEIILKVSPLSKFEIEMLADKNTVISYINLPTLGDDFIKGILAKKTIALGFEFLEDDNKIQVIKRTMSEIEGATAIIIAAEYLSNVHEGKGVLLGGIAGITPTEILIFGAGDSGEYAAKTALGLGATVKVFDSSVYKLRNLQNNLGQKVFTSVLHPKIITKELKTADVVIGAFDYSDIANHYRITLQQVRQMKQGSVLVDLCMEQGGCFETSEITDHSNPVFKKYGVLHYCVPNIGSRVARTASIALSNVLTPMLIKIGDVGGVKSYLTQDVNSRQGVYAYNGIITNTKVGNHFGIPSKDINLLMATL